MALYIKTDQRETTWHIGQGIPAYLLLADIKMILADGDELEHIQNLFCQNPMHHFNDRKYSIPMAKQPAVRWYGDIAKTIVGNL